MKFSIDTTGGGLGEFAIRARAMRGDLGQQIQEIMRDAGHLALAEMKAAVPRGKSSGPEGTIAQSLTETVMPYQPGGAGGGGTYEVRVGPGINGPSHLRYVLEGTGIHGPFGAPIYPSGKALLIAKEGESIFRAWSRGQRPQTEWLTDAQELATQRVSHGIHALRVNM